MGNLVLALALKTAGMQIRRFPAESNPAIVRVCRLAPAYKARHSESPTISGHFTQAVGKM